MTENKSFTRDGKKVKEHYSNGELEMYFETETTPHFEIIRGYSNQEILFYTEVIYKNQLGKPYMVYENIDQEPGFYRRINRTGAFSFKTYDEFYECMFHEGENLV